MMISEAAAVFEPSVRLVLAESVVNAPVEGDEAPIAVLMIPPAAVNVPVTL
jgi:hypothetical protein